MRCSFDLTERANADGRAVDFENMYYLCPTCSVDGQDSSLDMDVLEDYLILTKLGEGGMGIVYKAVHQSTGRVCAIKRILTEFVANERSCKLFEREVVVQSKVRHPNLVRILDRGTIGIVPYFVSEFMAGGDVEDLMISTRRGPLEPELACAITVQILRGIQALHDRGFIHRDLKPGNFLLDRSPDDKGFVVKITDYGLAKSYEEAGHSVFDYTKTGKTAGTYMFMAPEHILNYRYVKPPADVYAVGVSLYYMLSGQYSVDFTSPVMLAMQKTEEKRDRQRHILECILEDEAIPLLEREPNLPESLAKVVDKAVVKDLDKRYQSAEEFRKELESVMEKEGLQLQ
jgi:serine/threonine protein kinase